MGNTQTAEYLMAALTAMVIVATFRRKMPKALELAVWLTFVSVCVLAVTSTRNPQARALTTATAWAATRIVGMVLDVSWQSTLRWMYGVRFVIASWVIVVFALDLFALALVRTRRQADSWIPVTKLGEWMVLPRLAAPQPERAALSGVDEINLRLNVWAAAALAATVTWSTAFFMWLRDREIPNAARGLKNIELGTVAAWRRVSAGRPQLGELRISRILPALTVVSGPALFAVSGPTLIAISSGRRPKVLVLAESAPIGPVIIDVKQLAKRASARKANAGRRPSKAGTTTPRRPRRRTAPIAPQPDVRNIKNGSKKQDRPSRLAS